jgi:hypothetical protein
LHDLINEVKTSEIKAPRILDLPSAIAEAVEAGGRNTMFM